MTPNTTPPSITLFISNVGTTCEDLVAETASFGTIVVNRDELVRTLHAGCLEQVALDLDIVYQCVAEVIITSAISRGRQIAVVADGLTVEERSKYLHLGRQLRVPVFAVVWPFDTPLMHAIQAWAQTDTETDLEPWLVFAEAIDLTFESLDINEGFDAIYVVSEEADTPTSDVRSGVVDGGVQFNVNEADQ